MEGLLTAFQLFKAAQQLQDSRLGAVESATCGRQPVKTVNPTRKRSAGPIINKQRLCHFDETKRNEGPLRVGIRDDILVTVARVSTQSATKRCRKR